MKSQTFKIRGIHKETGKAAYFTIKEFSYSQAVRRLADKYPDYKFPEIYE